MATLLVLGVVFSTIALGLLSSSNDTIKQIQTLQESSRAYARSSGCAQYAIYALGQDNTYSGNEQLVIGDGVCDVLPINGSGDTNRTICAYAEDGAASRTLEVVIDSLVGSVVISSWQEVLTTPAACT